MRNEATFAITGVLGKIPEIKTYQGNTGPYKQANISIAVSKSVFQNNQWVDKGTTWFVISVSGKTLDYMIKNMETKPWQKGDKVTIKGFLDMYTPKETTPDGRQPWPRTVYKAFSVENLSAFFRSLEKNKQNRLNQNPNAPQAQAPVSDALGTPPGLDMSDYGSLRDDLGSEPFDMSIVGGESDGDPEIPF